MYIRYPLGIRENGFTEKTIFLETFTHGGTEEIYYIIERVLLRHFKKLVTSSFYSKLLGDENLKDHGILPKSFV